MTVFNAVRFKVKPGRDQPVARNKWSEAKRIAPRQGTARTAQCATLIAPYGDPSTSRPSAAQSASCGPAARVAQHVARIERSEIRESLAEQHLLPGFAALNPGYKSK